MVIFDRVVVIHGQVATCPYGVIVGFGMDNFYDCMEMIRHNNPNLSDY